MKTQLAASEIQALVERIVGPVSMFEPLAEGLESQVFAFRHGAVPFVVRVGRAAAPFEKDAFAARSFASDALPIPEIVSISTVGGVAVCISRRAPGARLRDFDESAELAARVLDVLAALDQADTSATRGFGFFDAQGSARWPGWGDFLLAPADPRFCDWALLADPAARRNVESAILAVERLAAAGPSRRGLIHGDLGGANLLSDGQAITGVIDWDRAMVGDGAYDQANFLFWGETRLTRVRALLTAAHVGDAEWERRMLCYQLRICLQELSESLGGLQPVDVGWLLGRCAELVEQVARVI